MVNKEPAPVASESGHWYYTDGRPCYEVPNKSKPGQMRPTTLRDARALDLAPGVTTIADQLYSFNLERYKRRQTLYCALTTTRREGEPDDSLVARIEEDADAHAKAARDIGTAIHTAIEVSLRGGAPDPAYLKHAAAAIAAVRDYFGDDPAPAWESERSFCWMGQYGGKVDLHAKRFSQERLLLEPDHPHRNGIVIDFKGTDKIDGCDLYDNHLRQLGGYANGLDMPQARGAIVFVSRDPDNPKAMVIEAKPSQMAQGIREFRCLLALWQCRNNFGPTSMGAQ